MGLKRLKLLTAGICRGIETTAPRRQTGLVISMVMLAVAMFPARASTADRPNVVMILADDQSYRDFGFMGNQLVHTPRLDGLAAAAARYPNGYVPMSVCRPSLATLMTGLYPHQHGIHFNHPPPGLSVMRRRMTAGEYRQARAAAECLIEKVATLPRILAKHGYVCLQTGKHWEGSYRTAGFTHGMTLGQPADRLSPVTGTRQQQNGEWVAHGNGDAGLVIGRETMQPIYNFIRQYSGQQPFFVWYAPFLPHTPFDAAPRFYEPYRDRPDIPPHLLPYYAEIARFDETVGQLLDFLDQHSLLQNTIIVFVSDNGFRPRIDKPETYHARSKLSLYEDGLRTPVLIRWDDHVVPGDHPQLVRTVDIVPTILSAVGLANERTERMTGIDLMPSALGRATLSDHPAFGAIYPNDAVTLGAPSRHATGRWIRDGQLKLFVPAAGSAAEVLFYDLGNDPEETTNLAAQADQVLQIERLRARLDNWWTGRDDSRTTAVVPPPD